MSIISSKDISDAIGSGRFHLQRFLKNAGIAGDSQWQDWSYASGQPAYDARIGDAATFTPMIASRNDAIYFPSKNSNEKRHLLALSMYITSGGVGQLTVESQLYDLLGTYPLIDGDSTDLQVMDNTQTLPRYEDGAGVMAVLVNHVAPSVTAGCLATISYTDMNDVARVMTVYTTTSGLGKASWALNAAGTSLGCLYLPVEGGGIKSIQDLTFGTAAGGLWAIYLVRPLTTIGWRGGEAAITRTVYTEKDLSVAQSFALPEILDGAWLGFFYMPSGSARTVAMFGDATFIWG